MDTILLVDDDEDIALLLQMTLTKSQIPLSLQRTASVKEAIQYLTRQNQFLDKQKFPFPCVVLLDMKLPGDSGFELLQWIREQSEFPTLPVVVWSGTEWVKEKEKAYEFGASLYIPKPAHTFGFAAIITTLKELCDRKPADIAATR